MNKSRCGNIGRWALGGAILLSLGLEAGAQDNNAACTLRGKDTVLVSGTTVKACLDVDALNNQTVVIPSNVTRIDNTGFSLCETSQTQGGLADIVYVMDQSGSMALNFAWVSPDGRDTVYMHGINGNICPNNPYTTADQNNFGTMTVLSETGTRQVKKLNPAKDPRTLCTDYWAGDPYSQRAIALRSAIDYQAQRAPNSRAGYVGFAGSLSGATTPRALNTPALVTQVKANINILNQGGTNYTVGLDQAKQWLNNPTFSPNPTKGIIFVSDGKPTEPGSNPLAYLDLLQTGMPPVYGIFLGVPRPDTLRLSELSQRTGGRFFLIPPDRPDSLRTVVERILNIILRQYQPNRSVVTNSTIIPNQTAIAGSTDFTLQENKSWLINFDRQVGLNKSMGNAVELRTTMREITSGDTAGKIANFTLSTTGPEERTNKNLPGTQFSVVCQDLPPDINIVKLAFIRDTDGDGAGDKVFFVFSRPLLALPASIDTVYWNKMAPGFNNKVAPKLSFLPGSNNTVVVADFTASPYPKGLTSIPEGEKPVGVLPPGGVFLSQRPAVQDSMGPIIDSGLARPYDNATGSSASLGLDTLVIYVSEPMRTGNTWDNMLLWGKPVNGECTDFANAKPVKPAKQPVPAADQESFVFIVRNGDGGPTPVVGDCIYLNVDGTQTDIPRNIPPIRGVMLRGRRPPREIELFRGFPPVAGFDADKPGFILVNNDPRTGNDNTDYSKPRPDGTYQIYWIPPVGFVSADNFNPLVPKNPNTPSVGQEVTTATFFPPNISAIQVVSTGKYIAHVNIFDNHGRFMKDFYQAFGYQGELNNGARVASKGLVSYLVWDMKDSKGQRAGQGVYVWKVLFSFENGKQEIQYTRTGVMRKVK